MTTAIERPPKPRRMNPIPTSIPEELHTVSRWVVWRWSWNGKKWDKPRMALSAVSGWRRGGWGVGHDEFVRHILDRYTRPSLATRWFVIECPRMCARSVCADRRERSGGVR